MFVSDPLRALASDPFTAPDEMRRDHLAIPKKKGMGYGRAYLLALSLPAF